LLVNAHTLCFKVRKHCTCADVEHATWIDVEAKIIEFACAGPIETSNALFDAPHIDKSDEKILIVLAGEALECLTAGLVQASLHRVGLPSIVPIQEMEMSQMTSKTMARYSIVFDLQVSGKALNTSNRSRLCC